MFSTRRTRLATALAGAVVASLLGTAGAEPAAGDPPAAADPLAGPLDPITLEREHDPAPDDRYEMAGGCYAIHSEHAGGYVERDGDQLTATAGDLTAAEPVGFQAFDLGKYLFHVADGTPDPMALQAFVGVEPSAIDRVAEPAGDAVEGLARGAGDETLDPARDPAVDGLAAGRRTARAAAQDGQLAASGGALVIAGAPGANTEWIVREAGEGLFTIHLPVDDGAEDDPGPDDTASGAPIVGTLVAGEDGRLTVVTPGGDPGEAAQFSLALTGGCPPWPEVGLGVDGPHPHGGSAMEESRGYLDAHLHMMAFEFLGGRVRCGRPWHPYGVTRALVDCPDHEPGGRGALLEQILSGSPPGEAHATEGWPGFPYWPRHDSLTHEQVYYRWLERSWRAGQRMFVNLLVDNGVLCEVYPYKENSCNEMDGVRLQAQRLRELERYVDAQWGGPGEGWFRIVTDPFEARRTMNEGRLAVVIGIEVSVLFDCGEYLGLPRCTAEELEDRLDEVYALGIRQMEFVNKFDNALSGVTGDGGETGVIVNQGNRWETGHYWRMHTCDPEHEVEGHSHDKHQINFNDGYQGFSPPEEVRDGLTGRDALAGGVFALFGQAGLAPVYPEGPHCNEAGLTPLGKTLLLEMFERGMIFDPDHMSARGRHESLDVVAEQGYSGVVSSHGWADDEVYRRVLELGGVVAPYAGGSAGFVDKWRRQREWVDDRFVFGLAYGADTNGFGSQGGPRHPAPGQGVTYPFTGLGGVTVSQQVSGTQVYDVDIDGVDHYGLYPDWIEDLRVIAETDSDPATSGEAIRADLERGPEAYLQMWERAIGVLPDACRADIPDLTAADVAAVGLGDTPGDVLAALGQPHERSGSTFAYCTDSGGVEITFDADGEVETVSPPD